MTVGDEKIMEKALDDCIDKVMEGYLKKEDGEFLRLANLFVQNRKYDKFKEYVKKIVYFASTKKDKYEFYELCANYDREALEGYYLKHGKLIIPYIINIVSVPASPGTVSVKRVVISFNKFSNCH